jgi:uncharacterized membrane protein
MIAKTICVYLFMTVVCCCYVYLHTDYSKVSGGAGTKIVTTVILSLFWPLVFLYGVLSTIKKRKQQKEMANAKKG